MTQHNNCTHPEEVVFLGGTVGAPVDCTGVSIAWVGWVGKCSGGVGTDAFSAALWHSLSYRSSSSLSCIVGAGARKESIFRRRDRLSHQGRNKNKHGAVDPKSLLLRMLCCHIPAPRRRGSARAQPLPRSHPPARSRRAVRAPPNCVRCAYVADGSIEVRCMKHLQIEHRPAKHANSQLLFLAHGHSSSARLAAGVRTCSPGKRYWRLLSTAANP